MNNLVVRVFEWQIIFCKGDYCAATILSFLTQHQNKEKPIEGTQKNPLFINMNTIYNVFSNKFSKILIIDSLKLLEQLDVITTKSHETQFIFNANVCNKWFAKYSSKKIDSYKEPSLDIEVESDVNGTDIAPKVTIKTDKANEVINQFLKEYKEINSIKDDNVYRASLIEPLILQTITSLREMIH